MEYIEDVGLVAKVWKFKFRLLIISISKIMNNYFIILEVFIGLLFIFMAFSSAKIDYEL